MDSSTKGGGSGGSPLSKWSDIKGDGVTERTQFLGHDSHEYRQKVNLPVVHREIQNRHNIFIHELGADVLKARLDEEKQLEMEREALKKKQTKVTKLLRRKIKVTDLEDGGVSISMDQEWDTSTWSEELIQAGCEALILIFYDSSGNSSDERKERAVQMLQKLLFRHVSAELYIRKNIEMMIGKAANKLIRGGKCAGLLDLLYILHSCKEAFLNEMSTANFNGRAIDMLNQEARLAAIIIQHAFRASRNAKHLSENITTLVKHVGFGTDQDIRKARLGVVDSRTHELRAKWRAMHCFHPASVVSQIGGLRGPIHVGPTYCKLVLEIILHLISDAADKRAHGNREDVVRADGCILLTTFLASPSGPFCRLAAAILSNLSNVWESFLPMLTSGCLSSAVKAMHYLRTVLDVGKVGLVANKHEKVSAQGAYECCLDLITHTAQHAAAMYRACMGYRYIAPAHGAVERVDYRMVLSVLESTAGYTKARLMDEVKAYLGHSKLLRELSAIIVRTEVPELLTRALRCQFAILCSEAHDPAVTEITALQGILIVRIVDLVHHKNVEVGTLALCICLQMCSEQRSRKQLARIQVEKLLTRRSDYYTSAGMMHQHPALHRNIAFTAALCRQFNWRYYDPTVHHSVVLGFLPFNENQSNVTKATVEAAPVKMDIDAVRHLLYLDLLRTMRTTDLVTDERAEQQDLADWVILPNDEKLCLGMSTAAGLYGAKALVDFLCHPGDANYYEALPLEQSAATCVLLEGLSANIDTAFQSFSAGTISFMSKYIYLCKYLFLGKRMVNSQILVILNGVKSAVVALGRYARAVKPEVGFIEDYVHIVQNSELVASVLFFMNTLSISHPKLEKTTRDMQKVVGIACLRFLGNYAELLIAAQGRTPVAMLSDLYVPAQATVQLIQYLKMIHKRSAAVVEIFKLACDFLCQVTETTEAGTIAIQEWKIFDSLRIYLPTPLSGILPLEEAEISAIFHNPSLDSMESAAFQEHARRKAQIEEYKVGLMDLPSAFFVLLSNLCKIDEGKALSFSEGYVRRALDRLSILNSMFIKNCAKYARNKAKDDFVEFSESACACLRFITRAANYNHAKHGSSNDLILHELYEFVPMCKNIICWQLHTKVPRTDEVLQSSYEALAAIAKDTYRINKIFEKYDLYGVIRHELAMLHTLPERGARAAVTVIDRSCHGLTSKYIVDIIPHLREPLTKVSRIYPQLSGNVRDCNWTLTRSAKLYKETVDATYNPDQVIDLAMEEFIRTGDKHAHTRASLMISISPSGKQHAIGGSGASTAAAAVEKIRAMNEAHMFSKAPSVAGSLAASVAPSPGQSRQPSARGGLADAEHTHAGTYMHCGVSNCGSLLLPDQHHFHGATALLSPAEREQQLLKLTFNDPNNPDLCTVSKLSARGPGLQNRMSEVKSKAGFRDIKRYSPDPMQGGSPFSQSSSSLQLQPLTPQKDAKLGKMDQLENGSVGSFRSPKQLSAAHSPAASVTSNHTRSALKGGRQGSVKDLRSMSSPALVEKSDRIRQILLSDLPELILTRPK